jgi:DNA-binding MarR family transcriptional regulator
MSKKDIAAFLKISRRAIFRSIGDTEKMGLIERSEHDLRATEPWIKAVEVYSINTR